MMPTIPETAWIAETATVRGDVTLGEDVSVWFGAVLRGDEKMIVVGDETNIQDGAVLHVSAHFPCKIGKRVTVGHRAIVHGCTIEDDVLIGMGAIVLDGAHVGRGVMIAAGALVAPGMQIPPYTLVLGVPGKIRGALDARQRKMNETAVNNYLARKEAYRRGQY